MFPQHPFIQHLPNNLQERNVVHIKIQNSYSTKYPQMRPATFKMSYWYARFTALDPASLWQSRLTHSSNLIGIFYLLSCNQICSANLFFKAPNKHPAGPMLQWCHQYTQKGVLNKWRPKLEFQSLNLHFLLQKISLIQL